MATIENQICSAVEVIAGNMIKNAPFDKTIQATIVACIDEAIGKYKVKYQDNTFHAYSGDVNKKYSKGNRVYILIPGNDMTRDKTILGTVGQGTQYSETERGTSYELTSPNLIDSQNSFGYKIYSGTAYNLNIYNNNDPAEDPLERYGKNIYENSNIDGYDSNTIKLKKNDLINSYMKHSDSIKIEGNFKTNLSKDITQGEYGIKLMLLCGDDSETRIESLSFDFDHGIVGSYYGFYSPQYQYFIFPKPADFIRIDKIEFFVKDFEEQEQEQGGRDEKYVTDSDYNIFVSNLGIYTATAINEASGNCIRIVTPGGTVLTDSGDTLTVKAKVQEQGAIMNDDANQFYWFKKDFSVNTKTNAGYQEFGGYGWYCLNEKNSGKNWKSHNNVFVFNDQNHLLSKENEFMVISYREVGETRVIYRKTFTLTNQSYQNFEIKIVHNKDTNALIRSVKDLELSCYLNSVESNSTYKYYWGLETNRISIFKNSEVKKFLNCKIINESIKQKNKKITNIVLDKLEDDNYIIFYCTVKKVDEGKEKTLGTASIFFSLSDAVLNDYTLELVNGSKVFQYDEFGNPPTTSGTFSPDPLFIKLIDNKTGSEIDLDHEILSGNLTIEWVYTSSDDSLLVTSANPEDNYLSDSPDGQNYKVLNYTLKGPYTNKNLNNNSVTVNVTFNNLLYTKTTNFTFIAQGDSGTNGTIYSARIVPKTDGNAPNWVVFTTNGGNTGSFNFGSYNMDNNYCRVNKGGAPAFPFKVQLFENDKIVFEGDIISPEEQNTFVSSVKWSMNTHRYDNSSLVDKSNFSILEEYQQNGIKYLTISYNKKLWSGSSKLINSDRESTPANILKCEVTYTPQISIDIDNNNEDNENDENNENSSNTEIVEKEKFVIYATLPIVTIVNKNSSYALELDDKSGYSEVTYDRDSSMPRYASASNTFKVKINNNNNISSGNWYIKGYSDVAKTSDGNKFLLAGNLLKVGKKILNDTKTISSQVVDPVYRCNSASVTNAILFKYKSSFVHIPIDIHLNRYGLAMFNEWDGNAVEINNNGGYIIAPQLAAGKKNPLTNTFTGIAMGEAKEESQRDLQTGLYAYHEGVRTFGLIADTGVVTIGKRGTSQIVLDPSTHSGFIYSGNFFRSEPVYKKNGKLDSAKPVAIDEKTGLVKPDVLNNLWAKSYKPKSTGTKYINKNKDGMLLDFSGHIYFANGKFHLRPNGYMFCASGSIGGFEINGNGITSNSDPTQTMTEDKKENVSLYTTPFGRNSMNVPLPQGKNSNDKYYSLLTSDWGENTIVGIKEELHGSFEVERVALQTVNLENLLFAIGDDFAVRKDGTIFAKKSCISQGCFDQLVCRDLVINRDLTVRGSALIKGNLYVEGNIYYNSGSLKERAELLIASDVLIEEPSSSGTSDLLIESPPEPLISDEDELLIEDSLY